MRLRISQQISDGYTLIEVLIATAVLAIALTGVAAVVVESNRLNEYNREKKIARTAAKNMMEQIQSRSITEDQLIDFLNNRDQFEVQGLSPVEGRDTVGSVSYSVNPNTGATFPVKANVVMRWEGILGRSTFSITKIINKSY